MLVFFPLISLVVPTAVTGAFVQEANKIVILLCFVTPLPQVLAMTAFIQHFIKGFGNHQRNVNIQTYCLLVYYPQHQERETTDQWKLCQDSY